MLNVIHKYQAQELKMNDTHLINSNTWMCQLNTFF